MNSLHGSMVELNPYRHLKSENHAETYRLNSDVSRADYNAIKAACPEWGTLQTTVNLFIKAVADELRRLNITTYDPASYRAVLARFTNPQSPPYVEGDSVQPGRTESSRGSAAPGSVASESTDARPRPKERRRRATA